MFSRIGAVILLVSDMNRSVKFYRDVLKMPLRERSKDWVEFSDRGTVIALHPAKKKRFPKNNSMLVGFSVSDFDAKADKHAVVLWEPLLFCRV